MARRVRALLTRSMLPGDVEYIKAGLEQEAPGACELVVPPAFDEDTIVGLAPLADVLLGPYVTNRIMDAAARVSLVQVPWTGMDGFDFGAVRGRGVAVCNTHTNASAVAELALALLLDLAKRVSYHDRLMRTGDWNRTGCGPLGLQSTMVSGSTVCVLGYGSIGSRVGRACAALGAKVIAVDAREGLDAPEAEVYGTERTAEALSRSDAVVCCVPLTDSTRGLIGREALAAMSEGALLVNVSRAALVDEDALWDVLVSGRLSGFAADVWWCAPRRGESESWPSARHPFHELDNVVLSPHRAGFVEGQLPHLDGAIANIAALAKGFPLEGVVDVGRGY